MISLYMVCLATSVYSWAISDVLSENNNFQFPNSTVSIRETIIMTNAKWDYIDLYYYYIGDISLSLLAVIFMILVIVYCLACIFYGSRKGNNSTKKFKKQKQQPLLKNEQTIYEKYGIGSLTVQGYYASGNAGQYAPVPEFITQQYTASGYTNIQPSAPSMERI